jgi:histidine triad (HIT) family protein
MPADATYDQGNVFARILRGELPNRTAYEDEHTLAFEDIHPQAPTHVLVIPKGPYVSLTDFAEKATDAEIVSWVRAIGKVARQTGVDQTGFRTIANNGEDGAQDVPHLHMHVLGGRRLGRMLAKPE